MRLSAIALLTIVLPLTVACDEEPDGTYALVAPDDDELPAVDDGVAITAGAVEIREDSLIWTETTVYGYRTTSPHEIETRVATAYEVDGEVIRTLPEAHVIPDDTFMQCAVGGVYRLDDGGETLRMIDMVTDGECRTGVDPVMPDRVYRRR